MNKKESKRLRNTKQQIICWPPLSALLCILALICTLHSSDSILFFPLNSTSCAGGKIIDFIWYTNFQIQRGTGLISPVYSWDVLFGKPPADYCSNKHSGGPRLLTVKQCFHHLTLQHHKTAFSSSVCVCARLSECHRATRPPRRGLSVNMQNTD